VARADAWRPLLAATVVAAVPALAATTFFAAAGFPGFFDLLQDLPTGHFSTPDIADPVGWTVSNVGYQVTQTLLVGLLARPLVLALVAGAVAGLVLTGRWWTAPFLASLLVIPISYVVHPETSELARTLAPAWVSVHTGLALLVVLGAVRWRARVLEVADRLTRAEDRIPLA
jgi:hypothetical protein